MTKTPPCHWHNPQHHAPGRRGEEKKAAHLTLVFSSILILRKRGEEKKAGHLTLVFSSILIPGERGEEKKAAHHRRRNGTGQQPMHNNSRPPYQREKVWRSACLLS